MRTYGFISLIVLLSGLCGCATTRQADSTTQKEQNRVQAQMGDFSAWGVVTPTPKGLEITLNGDLLFKVGHTRLSPEGLQTIDGLAAVWANHPGDLVNIKVYTDNSGSSPGNLKISQRRADAIKAELVAKGVLADYVSAGGKGDADPVAPNDTAENRAKNRRAVLEVACN